MTSVVDRKRAMALAIVAALVLAMTTVAGAAASLRAPAAAALAASCGVDEFDGTALGARWSVLRPVESGLNVADGKLNVELRQGDLITGTASVENLALQDAPDGGWIATTKFNIASIDTNGEQAGIALWKSEGPPSANNVFAKATFIQVSSGAAGTRRFESIWTDGGGLAVPISPSSQTDSVTVDPNADVMVRMRSDSRTVVAEYSLDDGATWNQIGQPARISGPVRVGPLALRGSNGGGFIPFESFDLECGPDVGVEATPASGAAPLTVEFIGGASANAQNLAWDFGDGTTASGGLGQTHTFTEPGTYRVTLAADGPAGTVTRASTLVTVTASEPPCPVTADEFSGNALDPKWEVLRPRLTGLDVSGGNLRLNAYGGDMSGGRADARNVLLQRAPAGPWTATTKIDPTGLNATGDQAGLLVWRSEGPNNFAKLVYNRRGATTYWVERSSTRNGSTNNQGNGNSGQRAIPQASYLRITSDGAAEPNLQAYYSEDGETWTALQEPFQVQGSGPLKFGLTYFSGDAPRTAPFEYFHVTGATACGDPDTTAPVSDHTLNPATPSPSGWFNGTPKVTLGASDDAAGTGVDRIEYRIDGGEWTAYSAPFDAPAGAHILDYRSADRAGNVEALHSFAAKVDPDAPTTSAALDPADPGAGGTYRQPVHVSLNASDGEAGSGVENTEYRVDGGPWANYGEPADEALMDGTAESLARWAQAGPGGFDLQPDGSIQAHGGLGMLWYPVRQFGDFSLKFRFRDARTDGGFANSGALVRFPDPRVPLAERTDNCAKTGAAATDPAWVAIFCGQEIQMYDGPTGEAQKTGSIYNFQSLGLAQARTVPQGEWSDYEIRVIGQQYTIIRDGVVINRFDNSIPKDSSRAGDPPTQERQFAQGFIGLQNHSDADKMQIRDVRISDLSRPRTGAFTVAGVGAHKVEFRSRDSAGNLEETKSVEFTIAEPPPANCGTDNFDGTQLDDRWQVLRPVESGLNVADGKLNLELRQGDLITGTANAENVVLQDTPDGGWTATTKFNIGAIDANGEQAGMVLWKSEGPPSANNVFAKATFIQVSSGAAGTRRFESIWTDGGGLAVPISPSSQTDPVTVDPNADVMMRMRSDSRTVVAEYSLDDGETWNQIGQSARISGPLRVGPLALRGSNGGGFIPFDSFTLSCGPEVTLTASSARGIVPFEVGFTGAVTDDQDDDLELSWDFGDGNTASGTPSRTHMFSQPGTYRVALSARDSDGNVGTGFATVTVVDREPPCPAENDEFSGNALDPKWEVLRPRLTGLDVAGGSLNLNAYGGDMYGGGASASNVLLQTAPAGAWTASTKIDVSGLTAGGDQVGLIVWRSESPNHFAKIVFNRRSASTYWFERAATVDGAVTGGNSGTASPVPDTVYIRASSDGQGEPTFTAEFSLDGTDWTPVEGPFGLGGSGPVKVGVTYFSGDAPRTAKFDWFHLVGRPCLGDDTSAPTTTHTLTPADPDGEAGWYTSAVEVALAASDGEGGTGVEKTEYRVDGGAFQPYSEAFTVAGNGHHTVDYRSVDLAGNAEPTKSVAIDIDGAAPATTAQLDPARPRGTGWYDGRVAVTLRAADTGGSGVDRTEYRVDGGAFRPYAGAFDVSDGDHTVEFRSVDKAGNAEAAKSVALKVDAKAPATQAALDQAQPGDGVFRGPVAVSLAAADGSGGSGVENTEYRLDGGAFQRYGGAFTVSALGGHLVEFRSTDRAGNVENLKELFFTIAAALPAPTPTPPTGGGTQPVEEPPAALEPAVAISSPRAKRIRATSVARNRLRVRATCEAVTRGTLRLTVSRKVARRLGLKSTTLAKRSVRCDSGETLSVVLKPSAKVKRALRRAQGTVSATLRLRMTGADGDATATKRLKLRGKRRS